MSAYRTEATEEDVEILCFVPNEQFELIIQEVALEMGIITRCVKTSSSKLEQFLNSEESTQKWYKIFWFSHQDENTEEITNRIVKYWKHRTELTYFVSHSPFIHPGLEKINLIGEKLAETNNRLQQISPYTSVFLYQDVFQSPIFSLLENEIIRKNLLQIPFSYSSFAPIPMREIIKASIRQSFDSRGGKRKILKGEKQFFLDEIVKFFQDLKIKIKISDPNKNISYLPEGDLVELSSRDVDEWWSFVEQKLAQIPDERKKNDSDLPKPTAFFEKPIYVNEEKEDQIYNKKTNLVLEVTAPSINNYVEKKIKVISTTPILPRVSLMIPKLEIPKIKRSHLVLQSLMENTQISTKTPHFQSFQQRKIEDENIQHNNSLKTVAQKKSAPNDDFVEQRMKNLFAEIVPHQAISESRRKKKVKFNNKQKKLFRAILMIFVTFAIVLGLYGSSYFFIKNSVQSWVYDSIQRLEQTTQDGQLSVRGMSRWLAVLRFQILNIGYFDNNKEDVGEFLLVGEKLDSTANLMEKYNTLTTSVGKQVFFGKSGQVLESIKELSKHSQEYYLELAELDNSLSSSFLSRIKFGNVNADLIRGSLHELRRRAFIVHQLSEIAPVFLAKNGQKKYAIIVIDSSEIRPGGGVVVGTIILTIKEGKIVDNQSFSNSEVDMIIGGDITAPKDFSDIFQQEFWSLSDVAWKADFSHSSVDIINMLNKLSPEPLDGIIGITDKAVVDLLRDDEIVWADQSFNASNLKQKYLNHLTTNSDSENLLFSVTSQLINSLIQPSSEQLEGFYPTILRLIENEDIRLYSKDNSVQDVFNTLHWSGKVLKPACPQPLLQEKCEVVSIYQIDANLNKNKANAYITKSVKENIDFKVDQTVYKYIISYESVSNYNSYPNGNIQNFSQIYLDKNVVLQNISINREKIENKSIFQSIEEENLIISFYHDIPPGKTTEVMVEYVDSPIILPSSFAFFNQKQPGLGRIPTTVVFRYIPPIFPTLVAPEAQISTNEARFQFFGDQHSFAGAKFRDISVEK